MNEDNDYFSVKEFANKLGVHTNTIYRAIKKGKIYATPIGKAYRIHETELQRIPIAYMKSILDKLD